MKSVVSLLVALALVPPAFADPADRSAIRTLLQHGRAAAALPVAEAAVRANPRDADAQDLLGQSLALSGKPDDAVEAFTVATALDPENAGAFTRLGDAHMARFMTALRLWVKDHYPSTLGMDYRNVPAAPDFGKVDFALLEGKPRSLLSLEMNAKEWERFQKIAASARDAYAGALQRTPGNPAAIRGRGLSRFLLGDWREAASDFEAAGAPAFDPFIYDILVHIYDGHKMGEEAIRLWTQVARSEPTNGSAYWNLRNLYNELHRNDWHFELYDSMRMPFSRQIRYEGDAHRPTAKDGLRALQAISKKHGDDALVWRGIGIASSLAKDDQVAEAAFKKSLAMDPTDWYAHFRCGVYRLAAKDAAAALPLLQKAVTLQPENAMAWHALGSAAEKNKDLDTAVAAYERAAEINPNWAEAHLSAGALLLDRRQGAEALPHLERYLELSLKAKDADSIRAAVKQVKDILAKQD